MSKTSASAASGTKTRLTMTRYSVQPGGTYQFDSKVRFEAMINPAEIKHTSGISYDKQKSLGRAKSSPKFSDVENEMLNFAIVLDSTGVVPGTLLRVDYLVSQLNKVVYQYVGTKHEPPHVRLIWGSLIFFGRMKNMSTQYTLFKPSGEPLRAKVDLGFIGAMSKKEGELVTNRSSPDLSHRIQVREGDTLPLLCHQVYGDAGYYLDVAAFNGLADFRRLVPGRQLHFPPLE